MPLLPVSQPKAKERQHVAAWTKSLLLEWDPGRMQCPRAKLTEVRVRYREQLRLSARGRERLEVGLRQARQALQHAERRRRFHTPQV